MVILNSIKILELAGCSGFIPVIPAPWEAEIKRIAV
jgi:hypothetical protein